MENVEQEEAEEMETDVHCVGTTPGLDITDDSIVGEETSSEVTDEDIKSILERYILTETTASKMNPI